MDSEIEDTGQIDAQQVPLLCQKVAEYVRSNDIERAERIYHQLKGVEVEEVASIVSVGGLAMHFGDTEKAIELFEKVVSSGQGSADHFFLLGHAYNNAARVEDACDMFSRSIEINPDNPAPYVSLGQLEYHSGNNESAARHLKQAVELAPDQVIAYFDLVIALRNIGEHQQALDYAKKMVELNPDAANLASLGRTYFEMGDLGLAEQYFRKAISVQPEYGISYYEMAHLKKYTDEDAAFIQSAETILQQQLPAHESSHIHFALGKVYNDCGEWDKAITHFHQGNEQVKSESEPQSKYIYFELAKQIYNEQLFVELSGTGHRSEVPVFVVGMPRSGTTLVEQIIASHPDAFGAGELRTISDIDASLLPSANLIGTAGDVSPTAAALLEQAEMHLAKLAKVSDSASRVVDKMPENFLRLGLIHLLFPAAKIIHVVRNPLDTCLSIYFQSFRNVAMSHHLEWIANYYAFYREVMTYWRSVLPEGTIVDVSYEELVAEPEHQIRQLIEVCGLPWDDACLESHNSDRAVTTTSLWQVRQPIYTSSSRRWRHYAKYLQDAGRKLNQYLDDEDRKEFASQGIKLS